MTISFGREGKFQKVCKMASYTLSTHCKLVVKVFFDRVCSVALTSKLREVCSLNLDKELQLLHIKVASEKNGPWSDIDCDETVSALAALGLRYVLFVLEDRAASAEEPEEVASQQRNVVDVLMHAARNHMYLCFSLKLYVIKLTRLFI